ncbi:hypothetical protein FHR92_005186 [Fontibacillus solani]|uniref:Uncharacterized protein n=1 Tax=Fontibacillus solani TaxID=1572857 RepID=A0A7W3XUH6_9BACL|nr:hypothetical protein [Fontibacillus solani]MBA9088668.1 hypothetical protein [Fontibacillus solani]
MLKGWSSDRKFYIEDQAGAKAAAETIAGNTLHRKQQECSHSAY